MQEMCATHQVPRFDYRLYKEFHIQCSSATQRPKAAKLQKDDYVPKVFDTNGIDFTQELTQNPGYRM